MSSNYRRCPKCGGPKGVVNFLGTEVWPCAACETAQAPVAYVQHTLSTEVPPPFEAGDVVHSGKLHRIKALGTVQEIAPKAHNCYDRSALAVKYASGGFDLVRDIQLVTPARWRVGDVIRKGDGYCVLGKPDDHLGEGWELVSRPGTPVIPWEQRHAR